MIDEPSRNPAIAEARRYEIVEETGQFFLQLATEGERAAVVMGAARIDFGLEKLLKTVMRHDSGGTDNLFDPDRPLGTFSAKISLAYRLGLVNDNFERALQMLRKIRNDFAHSTTKPSLSESRHRDRLLELSKLAKARAPNTTIDLYPALYKQLPPSLSHELKEFCASVYMLLIHLEVALDMNEPFVPKYLSRLAK